MGSVQDVTKLTWRDVKAESAILDARDALPARMVSTWRLIAEARRQTPGLGERHLLRALLRLERQGIMRRVKRVPGPREGQRPR